MIKEVTRKEAEQYGFSISGETCVIGHVVGLTQPDGEAILFCLGKQDMQDGWRLDTTIDKDCHCYSKESLDYETLRNQLIATMEVFAIIDRMGLAHIELSVVEHLGFRRN